MKACPLFEIIHAHTCLGAFELADSLLGTLYESFGSFFFNPSLSMKLSSRHL